MIYLALEIDETLILKCLEKLNENQTKDKIYYDYYMGNHSILTNYSMQDSRSNMKLVFNFPRKFVDNEVGYLLGKPVNYISKSGSADIVSVIDSNLSMWDKEHNINLRKQSEIYGESYELDYVNSDGNFDSMVLNPRNTFVLEDGSDERNVLLAINTYQKPFDLNNYMDLYTPTEIISYRIGSNGAIGALVEIDRHKHIFNRVPIIVCSANYERRSGIADIVSLCDAYNQINSDLTNEIADNRQAYLMITGAKLDDAGLTQMKTQGVIQVPIGGKVDWLTKNINDSFVKNEAEIIRNEIYNMMDEVDVSQNWSSNTSGVAIAQKLLNLENRVAIREAIMEKVIKKRLVNLFTYVQKKKGVAYDINDVSIKFTRNLPTDLDNLADVISKLTGVCSQETLLSILPFVTNPELEVKKYKAEHSEDSKPDAAQSTSQNITL